MEDNSLLLTNGITIILAFLAAFITLYQVKANIISKSRISWIENLRDLISTYCVELSSGHSLIKNHYDNCLGREMEQIKHKTETYYPKYNDSVDRINKLTIQIILNLNLNEDYHNEIKQLVLKSTRYVREGEFSDKQNIELDYNINEIVNISSMIFKKEWKKSKHIFKF